MFEFIPQLKLCFLSLSGDWDMKEATMLGFLLGVYVPRPRLNAYLTHPFSCVSLSQCFLIIKDEEVFQAFITISSK